MDELVTENISNNNEDTQDTEVVGGSKTFPAGQHPAQFAEPYNVPVRQDETMNPDASMLGLDIQADQTGLSTMGSYDASVTMAEGVPFDATHYAPAISESVHMYDAGSDIGADFEVDNA